MPTVLPFRGLRFDAAAADLSAVICPPYDVIGPDERERLLARHRYNAVRVEFPVAPGEADSGYERAAETLRGWRAAGVLRLDATPALYAYEARYRLGDGATRVQRGAFGRLVLEPLGEGVRPHERTLSAPKEDRFRLLAATRTDTSPIVLLSDAGATLTGVLESVLATQPDAEATDEDGVRHRIWVVPEGESAARDLADALGSTPLTIADGHHRYETALRYRDEAQRAGLVAGRATPAADRAPSHAPEDHVMALVLDPRSAEGPTILPTHRIVGGDAALAADVVRTVHRRFAVEHRPSEDVVAMFSPPFAPAPGQMGVLTPRHAGVLAVDPDRARALFDAATPAVIRALDVAVLDAVLRPLLSDHPSATLSYTHDASEAAEAVASGRAAAAFLLAPTPIESVVAVAAAGAVMPQKSTYFYPKVATGLVMYPLE